MSKDQALEAVLQELKRVKESYDPHLIGDYYWLLRHMKEFTEKLKAV